MKKKYKKIIPATIYLILLLITACSIFVTYGLSKYLFNFETTLAVHFLFVSSGILFIMSSVIVIIELLEEEGVEYIVTEEGIYATRLIFFKSPIIKWSEIKSFSLLLLNNNKKTYILADTHGNELNMGTKIANIDEITETISQKSAVELQEVEKEAIKGSPGEYKFKTSKEKAFNLYSSGLKVQNIFNILIVVFLLALIFLLTKKLPSASEELRNVFFYIEIALSGILLISVVNLSFYKYWLNAAISVIAEILLLLINISAVTFFVITIIYTIYFYRLSYQLSGFYPLLIILLVLLIFLPLANLNTIIWLIKNMFNKKIEDMEAVTVNVPEKTA